MVRYLSAVCVWKIGKVALIFGYLRHQSLCCDNQTLLQCKGRSHASTTDGQRQPPQLGQKSLSVGADSKNSACSFRSFVVRAESSPGSFSSWTTHPFSTRRMAIIEFENLPQHEKSPDTTSSTDEIPSSPKIQLRSFSPSVPSSVADVLLCLRETSPGTMGHEPPGYRRWRTLRFWRRTSGRKTAF